MEDRRGKYERTPESLQKQSAAMKASWRQRKPHVFRIEWLPIKSSGEEAKDERSRKPDAGQ